MKITVNGAGVTPAAVSLILADLEKEYGLKVRDLTMYVRFAGEVDDCERLFEISEES